MGAVLEAVTVHHERSATPKQVRISTNVRCAIDRMVHDGKKRRDAATSVGITDDALRKALLKPEVCAYRNMQLRVIRESASARTIAKAEDLMDSAESEHVRLDATKWIAGLEGISPVTKSESVINHKGLGPGLTIIMAQPALGPLIDSQAHQLEYVSREKHLSAPVPHPSRGTAKISGDLLLPPRNGEGKNGDGREDQGTAHAGFSEKSSCKKSFRKKRRGLFADPKALDAVLRANRGK